VTYPMRASYKNSIQRRLGVLGLGGYSSHLAHSMNGRTSRVGIETATRSHKPPYDASCVRLKLAYIRDVRVRASAITFLSCATISAVSGYDGSPVNTRASTSNGLMVTEHSASATATATTNTRQLVPHQSTGTGRLNVRVFNHNLKVNLLPNAIDLLQFTALTSDFVIRTLRRETARTHYQHSRDPLTMISGCAQSNKKWRTENRNFNLSEIMYCGIQFLID
ncbi:hypothetical protein ALC57_10609, partial [Trachymyrmex cornetzi]